MRFNCLIGPDGDQNLMSFTSQSVELSMTTKPSGHDTSNLFLSCAPRSELRHVADIHLLALISIFVVVSKTR